MCPMSTALLCNPWEFWVQIKVNFEIVWAMLKNVKTLDLTCISGKTSPQQLRIKHHTSSNLFILVPGPGLFQM